MAPQPLAGLKVLDFSTLLPGPLAGLMLVEAGAEVIKIEPPQGDGMRSLGLGADSDSALYALLNAGKKSVCIDLKKPAERSRLDPMIEEADILIEQFRPGVMKRLGLDYEAVSAINPGIIYCSITGYGQDGPLSQRAGHDLNYLAETGILALSPGEGDTPCLPPVLAADIAGGAYPAFFNILLALRCRERNGAGQHIDVAMTEGMFPFAFWALAQGWGENSWPEPGTRLFNGGSPRYRVYRSGDGGLVTVAAIEEKFWRQFCDSIDLPAEMRGENADAGTVIASVTEIIASRPAAHWREVFDREDCCCRVVEQLAQAVSHPQFQERGIFSRKIETARGEPLPSLPLPISPQFRAEQCEQRVVARLGAQNALLSRTNAGED